MYICYFLQQVFSGVFCYNSFFLDNYIYILYILLCFQVENFFWCQMKCLEAILNCHLVKGEVYLMESTKWIKSGMNI